MSVDGDGKVLDLAEKFNIRELIERTSARRQQESEAATVAEPTEQRTSATEAVPSLDDLAPLPRPGDPYKAYARTANQMLPTLHLLTGDGQKWSFPYSGLVEGPHMLFMPDEPGKGAVIVMRFAASVAVEAILAGIRLDELHNYLGDHRIRWVRELPQGKMVIDDAIPMVRSMIVRPVSAEMQKGWPIADYAGLSGKPGK